MGIIDTLTKPIDWLSQIAPPFVKILLFMLFIVFFGGLITGLILSNKYGCDDKGLLVDESVFRGCGQQYMSGLVYKLNLTRQSCYDAIGTDDPYLNESICGTFLDNAQSATWWDRVKQGFSATTTNFVNWIKGIPSADSGTISIFGYLAHPEDALCSGLYDCMPPLQRQALHLTPNCTILRGQSNTADGYPTMAQFVQVSLLNMTVLQENIDSFSVFSVQCTDLGRTQGYSPEIVFLGIPLFSFELWLIILVFGTIIWVIAKI